MAFKELDYGVCQGPRSHQKKKRLGPHGAPGSCLWHGFQCWRQAVLSVSTGPAAEVCDLGFSGGHVLRALPLCSMYTSLSSSLAMDTDPAALTKPSARLSYLHSPEPTSTRSCSACFAGWKRTSGLPGVLLWSSNLAASGAAAAAPCDGKEILAR